MCEIGDPRVCESHPTSVKQHVSLFKPLHLSVHQPSSLKHTHTHTHTLQCIHKDRTSANASTHALAFTHAHVRTRSRERKLQHNDKVWEHNGLSSAQTEARTSLALKGQQASPSFHSVPPVIIVQHSNDYSDGLYFANVWSHSEIPMKYENAAQTREEKGKKVTYFGG